jgi:hypothetical protein
MRIVRRNKVSAGLEQIGHKGDVARQAIQLGDDELGSKGWRGHWGHKVSRALCK